MRLLLAEDEQALSKALTTILERNNYSVDAAYDGKETLEYLEADNYDAGDTKKRKSDPGTAFDRKIRGG